MDDGTSQIIESIDEIPEDPAELTSFLLCLADAEIDRLTDEVRKWKHFARKHERRTQRLLAKTAHLKEATSV